MGRFGQLLRTVIVVLVALATWLVTSPARAEAPMCDPRGATTFAPAPLLDTSDDAVGVTEEGNSECSPALNLDAFKQGRTSSPDPWQAIPEATLSRGPRVTKAPRAIFVQPNGGEFSLPRGVRNTIERPPR